MSAEPIPELTLRRLPRYYDVLRRLAESGQETVSASLLAETLQDVHPTQIRKDLAMTGSPGRPRVGHNIRTLMIAIEAFLHWNKQSEAFLVGAGNLGSAIVGNPSLLKTGITIVAAFDNSPRKIGTELHGIPVMAMDKFENLTRRMHIPIGILTVPSPAAQACADQMVHAGMRAIWNLTTVHLQLPPGMIVENLDLFASLAVVGRKLRELNE